MPRECWPGSGQTISAPASDGGGEGEGAGFNAAGRSCIFDERFPQVVRGVEGGGGRRRHIPASGREEGTSRASAWSFGFIGYYFGGNYRKSCVHPPPPSPFLSRGAGVSSQTAVTGRERLAREKFVEKPRGARARDEPWGQGRGKGPWRRPGDEIPDAPEIRVINMRERCVDARTKQTFNPALRITAGNCARCGGSRKLCVITCRKSRGDTLSFFAVRNFREFRDLIGRV
jgi:hypothetical protein